MTTFEKRIEDYIRANYDIPKEMTFWHGLREYDFEDWIEEYIAHANEIGYPYGEDFDECDVSIVGDELLEIMTSDPTGPYPYTFAIGMED